MSAHLGRRALWLLVLPLLVAASEVAQAVLDGFTTPSYRGAELLEPSQAHALLGLGGVGLLLLLSGFVGHAVAGCRSRTIPVWVFALLPPVLYVVQEHVEYWLGHHSLASTPATQSAFLLGLALQAPFALAAYLAARLLVRLADVIRARRLATMFNLSEALARWQPHRDPWCQLVLAGGGPVPRGPPPPRLRSH